MKDDDPASHESDRLEGCPHPREARSLYGHAEREADLLGAYRSGRLPHAWLIGGPEGIGKATLAWRFTRFLLANPDPGAAGVRTATDLAVDPRDQAAAGVTSGGVGDVAVLRREWNEKTSRPFSEIRVDDVRRAASLFQRSARSGGYRICIIDSVEDLNASGANALLKLIEEPPPLSLFFLVAHHPARILPTLRSRCRLLALRPLPEADVARAIQALGPPWSTTPQVALEDAAARSGGSVRRALHWLGGDRLAVDAAAAALLDRLPAVDWAGLHGLADRVGQDASAFDVLVGAILDWIHGRLGSAQAAEPGNGPRLARLAEVWDKVRAAARDADVFNLDRRATLFSIFADLARATRSS